MSQVTTKDSRSRETITVPRVDVGLLRMQRDSLLKPFFELDGDDRENFDGIVALLDTMLDIAEGYAINGEGAQ